jgi:chemotaxis signal transduction protein
MNCWWRVNVFHAFGQLPKSVQGPLTGKTVVLTHDPNTGFVVFEVDTIIRADENSMKKSRNTKVHQHIPQHAFPCRALLDEAEHLPRVLKILF